MASGIEDILQSIRNDPLVQAEKGLLPGHKIIVRFDYYRRFAACSCGWRYEPRRWGSGYGQSVGVRVAAGNHARLAARQVAASTSPAA